MKIEDPRRAHPGTSQDWYKGRLNVRFSYTIELRMDESVTNKTGFVLPPEEIIPRYL